MFFPRSISHPIAVVSQGHEIEKDIEALNGTVGGHHGFENVGHVNGSEDSVKDGHIPAVCRLVSGYLSLCVVHWPRACP